MNRNSRTLQSIATLIILAASTFLQAAEQPKLAFYNVPEWPQVWKELFHDFLGEEAFHLSAVLLCASDVTYFTEEGHSGLVTKEHHIPYIMGMQQLLRDPQHPLKAQLGMRRLLQDSNERMAKAYLAKGTDPTGLGMKPLNMFFQRRMRYGDQLLGALEKTIARKSINLQSLKGKRTYWLRLQIEESLTANEREQIRAQAGPMTIFDINIGLETTFIADANKAGKLVALQDQPKQELDWFREERETIINDPESARKLGLISKSESNRVEIDPGTAIAIGLFKGIGKIALGTFRNMKDSLVRGMEANQQAIAAGACHMCLGKGREECDGDGEGRKEDCLMCQGSGWRLCRGCGGAGRR
jgi:hypothetical protein